MIKPLTFLITLTSATLATPLVNWDFSKAKKYPQLTNAKDLVLVAHTHAQSRDTIHISNLKGGGALAISTFNTQENSLNLAEFRRAGQDGYLEFSIQNTATTPLQLTQVHIEAKRNGKNAPKGLRVSISIDGEDFTPFGQPHPLSSYKDQQFDSLNFLQAHRVQEQAILRILSTELEDSSGNLHFRKLRVFARPTKTSTAALISIGGISLQLH